MSSNQLQRISGNLEGNVFHHLRASRALVLMELQRPSNERENTLRGFVLELYAYLALVGNITITSEGGRRSIELDPFFFSLESLAEYPTFGFMFGCAYELFGMIPRICQLGRRRMMEDRRDKRSSELFSIPNSSTENSELGTAYTDVSRHWSREGESVIYRRKNLPERSSHIPSFVLLHFKCRRSNPCS